jgi:hypothetical protein
MVTTLAWTAIVGQKKKRGHFFFYIPASAHPIILTVIPKALSEQDTVRQVQYVQFVANS